MVDSERAGKIQELQALEQNLQSVFMQKQTLQMELNEISNASSEVDKATGEIYRVLGSVMLKADKNTVEKDLAEKKKVLDMKISSLEKQESLIGARIHELRADISSAASTKTKK